MATLRNKRELADFNKENCQEHPRGNLAQNSSVPKSQEDYITKVSEENEGRVTKKLPQEFSRTEKPHVLRSVRARRISSEPVNTGPLRNHSGKARERAWHKPGNE